MPPTVFDYSQLEEGFTNTAEYHGVRTDNDPYRLMDVNGDGRMDILFGPLSDGCWQLWLSQVDAFDKTHFDDRGCVLDTPSFAPWGWLDNRDRIRAMDVNGDLMTDIVIGPTNEGQYFLFLSKGNGFENPVIMPLLNVSGSTISSAYGWWGQNRSYQIRQGDVNGDGKTDLIFGPEPVTAETHCVDDGSGNGVVCTTGEPKGGGWHVLLSTVTATGQIAFKKVDNWYKPCKPFSVRASGPQDFPQNAVRVMDVDGDGRSDIVLGPERKEPSNSNSSVVWSVLRSIEPGSVSGVWNDCGSSAPGAGFLETRLETNHIGWDEWRHQIRQMDVNGDGRTDLVLGPNVQGAWFVMLSDGAGFVDAGLWALGAYNSYSARGQKIHGLDVNGDGRQDLVMGPEDDGDWSVMISRGNRFEDHNAWISGACNTPWSAMTSHARAGDFDGDGMGAIAVAPHIENRTEYWNILHRIGTKPDLLTKTRCSSFLRQSDRQAY